MESRVRFLNFFSICSYLLFLLIGIPFSSLPTAEAQKKWTVQRSGTNEDLFGVTFANSMFVAVGGTILTSLDGITWTSRDSGLNADQYGITPRLKEVAFGNSVFVAVGDSGTILTSPNGVNWTKRSNPLSGTNESLYGVAFGNSTFVAVGTSNKILTSPDGRSWTAQNVEEYGWQDVTFGKSTFVAVGNGPILTSPDGIAWTKRSKPLPKKRDIKQSFGMSKLLNEIIFGNSTFVAVGGFGTILTSKDGISWTTQTIRKAAKVGSFLSGVAFGNSTFVAVGWPSGPILTSKDGIAWNFKGFKEGGSGMTFGNSKFVIVGSGGMIMTSVSKARGKSINKKPQKTEYGDPRNLRVGQSYKVSKETTIMPFLDPPDPNDLSWMSEIVKLKKGGVIRILQKAQKRNTPWYRVQAWNSRGQKIPKGWVNSIALIGQSLEIVKNVFFTEFTIDSKNPIQTDKVEERYLKNVEAKVNQKWSTLGIQDSPTPATIFFRIMRDGSVTDVKIEESSGNTNLDNSAIQAVILSAPFDPLPEKYSETELSIHYNFTFSGNMP